jgi:hypothetical protein
MSYPAPITKRTLYRLDVDGLRDSIGSERQLSFQSRSTQQGLAFIDESEYTTCASSPCKAFSQVFLKAGVPHDYLQVLIDAGMEYRRECLSVKSRNIYPKSSVLINWLAEHYHRFGLRVGPDEAVGVTYDKETIARELERVYTGKWKRKSLVMAYQRIEALLRRQEKAEQGSAPIGPRGEAEPGREPVQMTLF